MTSSRMTESELRSWLRQWVSETTETEISEISDDTPMESFGLSSRDAVALSGELEKLLDVRLQATIAYEYPTIEALAKAVLDSTSDSAKAPKKPRPQARAEAAVNPEDRDIAIVGMSGRFPGGDTVAEYWNLLMENRSAVTDRPVGRWSEYANDPVLSQKLEQLNTSGGYLNDIASFDNEFFGVSPVEAINMDPQQRIMLEQAWFALEDASIPAHRLRGEAVGVYLGTSTNDYGMLISADPSEAHPYAMTGSATSIIPNRISYAFDFRGPSVAVDSACSSTLVAVHEAVRALRDGDIDVALAGGINLIASPFTSIAFAELGMISPTSAVHAFSDDADGFVSSEGAGILVLERVGDAVANGHEILAVIKGSAVTSDGHSNGLTAPNPDAQVDVLERAYADAGIDPADVDYIETQGTGSPLGDSLEAQALGEVVGAGRDLMHPLLMGSVKTNIGHTESASGAASLIKVVESMRQDTLPATINFNAPSGFIDFGRNRLEVVLDARDWPQYSGRKVAGISAFGFGGTNAHVVITDYDESDYALNLGDVSAQLLDEAHTVSLPVSGLLESRRNAAATELADFLEGRDDADLLPVARSLANRNHGRSSAVIQASTVSEATRLLRMLADGQSADGITVGEPSVNGPLFVFSGEGSAYAGMANQLRELSSIFDDRLAILDGFAYHQTGWSLLKLLEDPEVEFNAETSAVAVTAIQIALVGTLQHFGVEPSAVMGIGLGEIAAAYATGSLDDALAIQIAAHYGRLMQENEGNEAGVDAILGDLAAEIANLGEPEALQVPLYSSADAAMYGKGESVHNDEYFLRVLSQQPQVQETFERALGDGFDTVVEIAPDAVAIKDLLEIAYGVGKQDITLLPTLKDKADHAASLRDVLATLYVGGTDVDYGLAFGPGETIAAPNTQFKTTRYWTNARPASAAAPAMPGARVTLPDAIAFSTDADQVPSAAALMEAAVEAVDRNATLVATEEKGSLPASGEITTLVKRSLGGLTVTVHRVDPTGTVLVAEGFAGFATTLELGAQSDRHAQHAAPQIDPLTGQAPSNKVWDPASGESVEQHLRAIVSESMGYDVEDLPAELPLIDLGLDSLMGMRIKNRVEHDFQIPPIQIQALRDASVSGVVAMVQQAVGLMDTAVDAVVERAAEKIAENAENAAAPAEPEETSEGVGVAPRDASERMVFGTWARATNHAPAGVTSTLPEITREEAEKISSRLRKRSGIALTPEEILEAKTLETLADRVREGLETEVEGNVRVLRERPAGSDEPALFMFHPAGGSSVVYEPLSRDLPESVPVYGIERLEGALDERVEQYIPDLIRYADGHKVILGGWSFGGVLAMEAAKRLKAEGIDVELVALLDTVFPARPAPDTMDETKARWGRYAVFAKNNYGLDLPVPYGLLETAGEEGVLQLLRGYLASHDTRNLGLSAGVVEHQRASIYDHQIVRTLDIHRWDGLGIPVILFRAERMHDGAVELEPTYAEIAPDGGWGAIVDDLEVVPLPGDHLAVPDEPAIGIVAAHLIDSCDLK